MNKRFLTNSKKNLTDTFLKIKACNFDFVSTVLHIKNLDGLLPIKLFFIINS